MAKYDDVFESAVELDYGQKLEFICFCGETFLFEIPSTNFTRVDVACPHCGSSFSLAPYLHSVDRTSSSEVQP